jgi:hypothetical protein
VDVERLQERRLVAIEERIEADLPSVVMAMCCRTPARYERLSWTRGMSLPSQAA